MMMRSLIDIELGTRFEFFNCVFNTGRGDLVQSSRAFVRVTNNSSATRSIPPPSFSLSFREKERGAGLSGIEESLSSHHLSLFSFG